MSAEIEALGAEPAMLEAGHGGVFDVFVDEVLVFSKFNCFRFPAEGEIAAEISL